MSSKLRKPKSATLCQRQQQFFFSILLFLEVPGRRTVLWSRHLHSDSHRDVALAAGPLVVLVAGDRSRSLWLHVRANCHAAEWIWGPHNCFLDDITWLIKTQTSERLHSTAYIQTHMKLIHQTWGFQTVQHHGEQQKSSAFSGDAPIMSSCIFSDRDATNEQVFEGRAMSAVLNSFWVSNDEKTEAEWKLSAEFEMFTNTCSRKPQKFTCSKHLARSVKIKSESFKGYFSL